MSRSIHVLAVLPFLLASPAPAQEAPTGTRWYAAWLNGERVGYVRVSFEAAQVEGKPGWRYSAEMLLRFGLESGQHTSKRSSDLLLTDTFAPVVLEAREEEDGNVRVKTTRYGPTEVVEDQEFLGRKTTISVPIEGPVEEEQEVYLHRLAREGRLAAGARFEYTKVSTEQRRTFRETVVVDEEVPGNGWRVRIASELEAGMESRFLVDSHGRFIEGSMGPISIKRVSEEEAANFESGEVVVPTTIPVAPRIAPEHVAKIRSMVVAVTLRSEDPVEFPADGYQEVLSREGRSHTLRLIANRPQPSAGLALPVEDPAVAHFLRETDAYQSAAPEIAGAAAQIAKGIREPAAAAERLGRWVYENIEKLSNSSALSAVETLRQKKGDCTEHAALYVALARAAGLPSRAASGLLFTGDSFGRHAWAESWIGSWLPVDPAWGRIGTPPLYLSAGPEEDAQGVDRWQSLEMALAAGFELRILSVDLEGQVFDALDPAGIWTAPAGEGAIVERVVLRSGITFPGELAGVEEGRIVYRTPYGATRIARSDIERIEFSSAASPEGPAYADPDLGIRIRFREADWRLDEEGARKGGFLCLVKTARDDAAGFLKAETFAGDLEAYFEALQQLVKGASESEVERIEIGQGEVRIAAIVWRFDARGNAGAVLRYQMVVWFWRDRAYRLALWCARKDFERWRPSFEAVLGSIELQGE